MLFLVNYCQYLIQCEPKMHLGAAGEVVVGELSLEAVLMHDPVALLSLGSSTPVEDECLLHPDQRAGLRAVNLPVLPRGLPVPGLSGPVRPQSRRVLPVTEAVEVPFLLPHLRLLYKPQLTNPKNHGRKAHYITCLRETILGYYRGAPKVHTC